MATVSVPKSSITKREAVQYASSDFRRSISWFVMAAVLVPQRPASVNGPDRVRPPAFAL